jgi:hypothetical protein
MKASKTFLPPTSCNKVGQKSDGNSQISVSLAEPAGVALLQIIWMAWNDVSVLRAVLSEDPVGEKEE